MDPRPPDPVPPPTVERVVVSVASGRAMGWRMGMLVAGVLFAGGGVALVLWPHLLAYAVGGLFVALGGGLVVTALAARGSRRR